MKCPKCGCENDSGYAFCKECGEPLEAKKAKAPSGGKLSDDIQKNISTKDLGDKFSRKEFSKKKGLLLGVGIIVIVALIAIGINSLGIGAIEPGNEALINLHQYQSNQSNGDIIYSMYAVLTNAPKEANTYYAKATWYDGSGNVLMTASEDLKYDRIDDDNTMDISLYKRHSPVNISNCVIEITNNQGELVTSADYKWIDE